MIACTRSGAFLLAAIVAAGLVACSAQTSIDATRFSAGDWVSKFERDHPLSGRLWQPKEQRFTDVAALLVALGRADFVLIGEKHDNPDHHRLQSWLVERMIAGGRRVAVAFEMFTADQVPALTAYIRDHPKDAKGLGAAVGWAKRGWPDWELYRPIAQAALDAGLPVVAADLDRHTVRNMGRQGEDALDPNIRGRIGDVRLAAGAARTAMAEELRMSHCNMLSDAMTDKMIFIQRARNAFMAANIVEAAARPDLDGAVLITGFGHARTDRGVPEFLNRKAPGRKIVSIGLLESDPGLKTPQEYAELFGVATIPFDYIWLTPRHDTSDPCKAHAGVLKRLKERK